MCIFHCGEYHPCFPSVLWITSHWILRVFLFSYSPSLHTEHQCNSLIHSSCTRSLSALHTSTIVIVGYEPIARALPVDLQQRTAHRLFRYCAHYAGRYDKASARLVRVDYIFLIALQQLSGLITRVSASSNNSVCSTALHLPCMQQALQQPYPTDCLAHQRQLLSCVSYRELVMLHKLQLANILPRTGH